MNAYTLSANFPSDVTYSSSQRDSQKGFSELSFHRTKWRTGTLPDVTLSGEECTTHHLCVAYWAVTHVIGLHVALAV
jgi:hypothetical protein